MSSKALAIDIDDACSPSPVKISKRCSHLPEPPDAAGDVRGAEPARRRPWSDAHAGGAVAGDLLHAAAARRHQCLRRVPRPLPSHLLVKEETGLHKCKACGTEPDVGHVLLRCGPRSTPRCCGPMLLTPPGALSSACLGFLILRLVHLLPELLLALPTTARCCCHYPNRQTISWVRSAFQRRRSFHRV